MLRMRGKFFVDAPLQYKCWEQKPFEKLFRKPFYCFITSFKIVESLKCILTCKKLDIFNIKNQILYSSASGFVFDLNIIAT